MGEFLRHENCGRCGSSDAKAIYADSSGYCWSCKAWFPPDGGDPEIRENHKASEGEVVWARGSYVDIPKRKLREDICKKYGYQVGEGCQIAPYRDADGRLVAQKIRKAGKKFSIVGEGSKLPLFGQHLWKGGKSVVVTEGEVDALSVAQAFDGKWPAVSLPSGAPSAKKALMRAYEWLDSFDNIILSFDADEEGRAAIQEVCPHLPIGKVRIMTLPAGCKDANDALVAHGPASITQAFWGAMNGPAWRPDGIVSVKDLKERAKKPIQMGLPWCLEPMTKGTFGRRDGEVYTFGAGTGVGKTDFLTQQIEYDLNVLKQPVGIFFLEQPNVETIRRIAGKMDGKTYHIPEATWSVEEYEAAVDRLAETDLYLYNHFGQSDWEVIKSRIRFMHKMHGVKLFYIDHLTALADPTKERESLETIMAEIAGMAQELGLIIHLVSHLSTPEGKSHEEGGRVMLKHFKGARAIGFWTFYAFGFERDKNAEDPDERNITTVRCLKDRGTGRFDGHTFKLSYDHETCRLTETTSEF